MINIALISPNKDAYSETFIQQHRLNISGNIIFYFNGTLPQENDKEGYLKLSRIDKLKFKFKKKINLNYFKAKELALIKSFKKNKIQVVIAEYGLTAVSVCKVCEYLKLPLIPIFHGYDASIKSILEKYKTSYQEVFRIAYKVIAVSNKISKTLISLGCNKNKIIISPCAPDNRFFELNPNFKIPLFVGVGRFVDKKAPYYTILAFSKVLKKNSEAKLVIAGDGPLYNTCYNLIRHLGIEKNVDLPGVIDVSKVVEYYKEAIAYVQHSIVAINGDSEGTPVSILEASAAGLPVISTNHAGIPDVIIDNKTGFLVNEHDVDDMASKMLLLLNELEKAQSMGREGKSFVKKYFSKDIHIGILNKIINEALS